LRTRLDVRAAIHARERPIVSSCGAIRAVCDVFVGSRRALYTILQTAPSKG